jgi:hypothetical protein
VICFQAIHDERLSLRTNEECFEQAAGRVCVCGDPWSKMIRKRTSPSKSIALNRAVQPISYSESGPVFMEIFEQKVTVRTENFSVCSQDGFQERRRHWFVKVTIRDVAFVGDGSLQSPSFQLIFRHEPQFLVDWFSLRCGIQLDCGDLQII